MKADRIKELATIVTEMELVEKCLDVRAVSGYYRGDRPTISVCGYHENVPFNEAKKKVHEAMCAAMATYLNDLKQIVEGA